MANQPKKYKKFVATAATATLVASAIVPVASAASLSDIAGNTHEEAINALVDAKVISGYPDGTFKPNKTLTRSDVVKLLGKYLETEGYAPAADYATSPAFNDLKAGSNDELLKYASIVKEAGVFAGSNGNLLAGDKITRENMAVTLVRMINTLKDVSLEEYVAAQDFKGDVKDLSVAKAEARSAIAVLDFFDITNPAVSNFNPKGDTTRGQFATFLHKTINADFAGASATTGKVTAINNTTVEVTLGEAINVEAAKFTIEGLEVKNAVVKQTDAKTVVLTTAVQEGGKEYTVALNGNKLGKFTGVSAVLPESVSFTQQSIQGVYGQQVTVTAKVKVAEGQSAAGIPVVFNIDSNKDAAGGQFAKDYVQEVTTKADGTATYTYTQYNPDRSVDTVTVYSVGKANVRAYATVYWANSALLTVSEITVGNELTNGTKKAYKVNGDANTVYQIAFDENIGVTPDKIADDVKVTTSINTANVVPYQLTTGAVVVAEVRTNAAGEGSFTVDGVNGSATPIVFASSNTDKKTYSARDLQYKAPKVTFTHNDILAIKLAAEGQQRSAQYNLGTGVTPQGKAYDITNIGGREYTITVTDKNGKIASEGTKAYVAFDFVGDVYFAQEDATFSKISKSADGKVYGTEIKVGKDGKVKFRVAGTGTNSYVTPTVFLNTAGTLASGYTAELDKTDVQATAEPTYFVAANVAQAKLTVLDRFGRQVTKLSAGEDATFVYQTVDQNGFAYAPTALNTGTTTTQMLVEKTVTNINGEQVKVYVWETVVVPGATLAPQYTLAFDVTSYFNDVDVKDATGVTISPLNITQNLGNTRTYQVKSDATGKAIVKVNSKIADTVTVNVTGANNIFTTLPATVEFTASNQVANVHTANINDSSINAPKNELTFPGFNAVALFGDNIIYTDATSGTEVTITAENFIDKINNNKVANVTRTVKDGLTTFRINSVVAFDKNLGEEALKKAKEAANAVNATEKAKYSAAAVTAFEAALAAANALPETTEGEKEVKAKAIEKAVADLKASAPKFTSSTNVDTANTVDTLGLVGTTATSSVDTVATAEIKEGKVAITSKGKGEAVITIADEDTKTTSATIKVTVSETGEITVGTITKAVTETEVTDVKVSDLIDVEDSNVVVAITGNGPFVAFVSLDALKAKFPEVTKDSTITVTSGDKVATGKFNESNNEFEFEVNVTSKDLLKSAVVTAK